MILYGCITEKLDKKEIEDISIKQVNQILSKSNITAKSLPGYGNAGLKKKKLSHLLKKTFINIWDHLKFLVKLLINENYYHQ